MHGEEEYKLFDLLLRTTCPNLDFDDMALKWCARINADTLQALLPAMPPHGPAAAAAAVVVVAPVTAAATTAVLVAAFAAPAVAPAAPAAPAALAAPAAPFLPVAQHPPMLPAANPVQGDSALIVGKVNVSSHQPAAAHARQGGRVTSKRQPPPARPASVSVACKVAGP